MKQLQIYANFAVGDNLDEELFLETMEAAVKDILFDVDDEWMKINWGDLVESVEVSLLGNWNR